MKAKETAEPIRARARFYSAVEVALVALLVLCGVWRAFGEQLPQPKLDALRKIAASGSRSDLEAALRSSDPLDRLEAVGALGRLRDPKATQDLAEILAQDADAGVRQLAALRLTGTKDAAALKALATAARKDPNAGVRMQAVHALGGSSDAGAKQAVEQAKADADPRVQAMARMVKGEKAPAAPKGPAAR